MISPDVFPQANIHHQISCQWARFFFKYLPANNLSAVNIDDQIQIEKYPFYNRWQLSDIPGVDLVRYRCHQRWRFSCRSCAKQSGLGKPETFDFLGFTHFGTASRKNDDYVIGRKTISKRMRATLGLIEIELRRRMHDRVIDTGRWVTKVLQGHVIYFSLSGNSPSLWLFCNKVRTLWMNSRRRRSQKGLIRSVGISSCGSLTATSRESD